MRDKALVIASSCNKKFVTIKCSGQSRSHSTNFQHKVINFILLLGGHNALNKITVIQKTSMKRRAFYFFFLQIKEQFR